MLLTEWNWDIALKVRGEEEREEEREKVAKNALKEGLSIEMIQKLTGLNIETIMTLSAE
jgi:transposase